VLKLRKTAVSRRSVLRLVVGVAFGALAGSAPAQKGTATVAPTETAMRAMLEKRVTAYWAARKGSDLGAAYAYYSPAFRATKSRPEFLRDFQRLIRFPPEKFTVEAIVFQPGAREASVKVRLDLQRNIEGQNVAISGVAEETWVFVDRNWWKKDEPLNINV
jgi:hypothetical protein